MLTSHTILIIGEAGVGKTMLFNRLTNKEFSDVYSYSAGYFSQTIKKNFSDQSEFLLDITDTERSFVENQPYNRSNIVKFADAHVVLLCFDALKPLSLKCLAEQINSRDSDPFRSGSRYILVQTKSDLVKDDDIKVSDKEISHFLKVYNINKYVVTSAKENKGIEDDLFAQIQKLCLNSSKTFTFFDKPTIQQTEKQNFTIGKKL